MKLLVPLFCLLMSALAPPSGRPPTGPLERDSPRSYNVSFGVTIQTETPVDASFKTILNLEDTPIVMPVIFQSTFSRVDPESLSAKLWLDNREDTTLSQRTRLDVGFPFGTQLAVLTIPRFTGQSLRWQLGYGVQVYSSKIDETKAAQIPWPRTWPEEVQDGLQPQLFIESDEPIFAETVERVSQGKLRLVPPYIAAKELVRYCTNELQVSGDGLARREFRLLEGLEVDGALQSARRGGGSPLDLVCVCVALLRAANIPARPVIGIEENARGLTTFASWAEFYLPEAGWIPFDPNELRGKGIRSKDVREPWSEFGTMKNLNRRVPLAFHYMPPATVQTPRYPAVWGWDPRPAGAPGAEQFITLEMTMRPNVSGQTGAEQRTGAHRPRCTAEGRGALNLMVRLGTVGEGRAGKRVAVVEH